jgi:hypothetical protein
MASIDSIYFIKKSYCADYGTVRKFYDDVKTDIDEKLALNPSL